MKITRLMRAHPVALRAALVIAILGLSFILWLPRTALKHVRNPGVAIWSPQVIFGFYFAILALSLQAFLADKPLRAEETRAPSQNLFLLLLIGFCSDLVTVNYQEAFMDTGAYYGLIVLWDIGTFFILLRAVDLAKDSSEPRFLTSWLVPIPPILKLGREVLLIPYGQWGVLETVSAEDPLCAADTLSPYLDLFFGDLALCFWLVLPLNYIATRDPILNRSLLNVWASRIVFLGSVYWLVRAVENLAILGARPIGEFLCNRLGFVRFLVACAEFAIAAGVSLWFWTRWDRSISGTRFGITRR